MSADSQYLLWFANENVQFRLPEVESILQLLEIEVKWIRGPNKEPFWIVEFSSESDAFKFASRSVSLRSILKLWGSGNTVENLHESLRAYPKQLMEPFLDYDKSFRINVVTFNRTFNMEEKVDKIEMFNYLPAKGPVKLIDPDINLYYIEYYGLDHFNVPESEYFYYFGVWICVGQRSLISKYSLKKRKFIGNTTMDPQLSFIIANQALVRNGDLVMDPFVGTGSLLVAAAHFGGYVMGVDIDFLMLHGKTRPTRKQDRWKQRAKDESVYSNMKQYGTQSQYLDVLVGDSSLPFWHEKLKLDCIVTDPPYGIREATERIGSIREYKISEDHLEGHIPSKVGYCLSQIFTDLLRFAAKHLKLGGRIVTWIPVYKKDYDSSNLPSHPCLRLLYNSEQTLSNHTSRRLLTWEKVAELKAAGDLPSTVESFPFGFRQHYFGHGETRKQKKERIARELREKGLVYYSRNAGAVRGGEDEEESCVFSQPGL